MYKLTNFTLETPKMLSIAVDPVADTFFTVLRKALNAHTGTGLSLEDVEKRLPLYEKLKSPDTEIVLSKEELAMLKEAYKKVRWVDIDPEIIKMKGLIEDPEKVK